MGEVWPLMDYISQNGTLDLMDGILLEFATCDIALLTMSIVLPKKTL